MSQTKAQLIEGNAASEITAAKTLLGAGSVGAPSLTVTGDTNTGIYFPAADTIGFVEGGVEAARIDSSGKLLSPNGAAFFGTVNNAGNGAIMESGSNANGRFVKYADGTMICTRAEIVGTATTLNDDFNNLPDVSFPATYASPDTIVSLTVFIVSNASSLRGKYSIAGRGGTTAWNRLCLTRHSTTTGSGEVNIHLTAIGRWF